MEAPSAWKNLMSGIGLATQMIRTTDLLLTFLITLGGSIFGAVLNTKLSQAFHRELELPFPRVWIGFLHFTSIFPLVMGGLDVFLGGGSWLPWILANIALLLFWTVAFWLRWRQVRSRHQA